MADVAAPFDWGAVERELAAALVRTVESVVVDAPGERITAAVLDRVYRETDAVIRLPSLGVHGDDELTGESGGYLADLRFGADEFERQYFDDEWLGDERAKELELALTAEACRGTQQDWEAAFDRYLSVLVAVCRTATAELRAAGTVGSDFVAVLFDDERYEPLLRACLTGEEFDRLFPELAALAAERARVAALPVEERVTYYVSRLEGRPGIISSEEAERALRDIGVPAFPALIELLAAKGKAWQAAKLLADIGQSDPDVVAALSAALHRLRGPDRLWTARALARLGRLDLVLDDIERLSEEVVVAAVTAPYSSFRLRDGGAAAVPLDYRPFEDFLDRYPAYLPAVAEELAPGGGYCVINADEVDEAIRGLSSPHALVRRHAINVLGERRLGSGVAARVVPLLANAMTSDPDAGNRRLAILSLRYWRKDALGYVDAAWAALADPDPAVRGAAADWFQEQGLAWR
ncbi:DUF4303 domain-containing protein [Phytohabitans sp. LJ34]|uniref:DUF4303 domain-containing protein n=1 Tax=Phytohabitans sp. LJ34 TaxID=3452217 RepID=UPI003F8CB7B6